MRYRPHNSIERYHWDLYLTSPNCSFRYQVTCEGIRYTNRSTWVWA